MLTKAKDLKVGDFIDLEGDPYADPHSDNDYFRSEFVQVVEVTPETDDCVAVGIEGFDLVGFPVGHEIRRQTQA